MKREPVMKYSKWLFYAWVIITSINIGVAVLGYTSLAGVIVNCLVLLLIGVFFYMVGYIVTGQHKKLR
jgi:type IV secretory pathway VirB3-like protein